MKTPAISRMAIFALGCLLFVHCINANAAPKTRLFILSGQSNMKHLDPETSFTPYIKQAFPDDEIIVVKVAHSGQPISRWYRDWRPLNGELPKGAPVGDIYQKLMEQVKQAASGKPSPESIVFIWMQGEADANASETANLYETSLQGLLDQLRNDLQRPDLYAVIGRISDYAAHPGESKTVREAQMAVVQKNSRTGWIDTDDLNGKRNDLHFTKQGYVMLGERFAAKAIELIKTKP